jgi:mRNA-degrading endonuclease RelE of RelBE toxin-antitoxin system
MNTEFDITRHFEKDLKHFSKENQHRIADSINEYTPVFDTEQGDSTQHIYQPCKVQLSEGLDSSLYVLRVNPKIRVLLTIEDDPLFDRKLVTLIRVVNHDKLDNAFNAIVDALYKNLQFAEKVSGGN